MFSMTLTQTQMGYPPPIEHIELAASIRKEKGIVKRPQSASRNKPWHRVCLFTVCSITNMQFLAATITWLILKF